VVGIMTRSDLLKARSRVVEEEFRREQFIRLRPVTQDKAPPEDGNRS
jgi:hypothetical protein